MSEETSNPFDRSYIQRYAKGILRDCIFVGAFKEKRYVGCLKDYRHVIRISLEEQDLIKTLLKLKRRIEECYLKKPWIGITEPGTIGAPEGFNLWVVLPEEVLGTYWYKIRKLEFLDNEIRLKLDILRPFKENNGSRPGVNDAVSTDMNTILNDLQYRLKENIYLVYRDFLTVSNFKQTIVFLFALVALIVGSTINAIHYLLEYLLKLMRELSNLVRAFTPIFNNLLNFFGKIIFGLYNIIVSLSHGAPKPQPVYNNYIAVDPRVLSHPDYRARYNQYFGLNAPYPQQKGITLTPLE
ncbi:unnamed protein product [Callosobruchus maculatus]|uniref:Uncharacterized protein n=1 Tax=Callosobruchus maculatus TaxID=64391 RepID=A0A653D6J6_CALMS|nr:unnamed protein product [Callosobruchus maculatus]